MATELLDMKRRVTKEIKHKKEYAALLTQEPEEESKAHVVTPRPYNVGELGPNSVGPNSVATDAGISIVAAAQHTPTAPPMPIELQVELQQNLASIPGAGPGPGPGLALSYTMAAETKPVEQSRIPNFSNLRLSGSARSIQGTMLPPIQMDPVPARMYPSLDEAPAINANINAYTHSISSCDEAPVKASSGAYDLICEQRAEPATKSQLERRRVNPGLNERLLYVTTQVGVQASDDESMSIGLTFTRDHELNLNEYDVYLAKQASVLSAYNTARTNSAATNGSVVTQVGCCTIL